VARFDFCFLVEESEERAATSHVAGFSLRFEETGEGFVFGGGEGLRAAELGERGGRRAARGDGGAEDGLKGGSGGGGARRLACCGSGRR